MARTFGGNADFTLGATALESWLNSITMNVDVPVSEITAFSDTYQNVVAGKKNVTLELAGVLDTTSAAADAIIFGCIGKGVATMTFKPLGSTTAYYQTSSSGLTGTLVKSYSISLPVGDKGSFTASLQDSASTVRKTA